MREVLLIEPNYKNKYPPMGLMKISAYYKQLGDSVRFFKGDMKDLVVTLLCEDLLKILNAAYPENNWNRYTPELAKFIRYGKKGDIPDAEEFQEVDILDIIKLFRNKYKNEDYFKNPKFDIVGITTLFTFHWKITIDTINFAKKLCKDERHVIVGGIAATIVPDYMEAETGIRPTTGILDKPGALGDDNSLIIDTMPLDYSILDEIDYKYPASDAYFAYMTRGCTNKCAFCAVPKLEPDYQGYIQLKRQLDVAKEKFGEQRDLLLLDNNVLASPCFEKIIDEIKACGFERGATYYPPNPYEIAIQNLRTSINDRAYIKKCVKLYDDLITKCNKPTICRDTSIRDELYKRVVEARCDLEYTATKEAILALDDFIAPIYKKYAYRPVKRARYIDFNQGVDARLITPENMRKLAEVNIRPLRIAFDHWGLRNIYENAIRAAADAGITQLSNYMLYNFDERPVELYKRMKLTVDLCDELNISIYSFPMKYHPIEDPEYFRNREYIGKYWSRKYIRAVQAVLTSTHGKIGKGKQFFGAAFGRNEDEFEEILLMPEALIISRFEHDPLMRERYPEYSKDEYSGTTTNEWRSKFYALSPEQRNEAMAVIKKNQFTDKDINNADNEIKAVLAYYQIQRVK
ncbi:hypothetical protein LJC63_00035 [Ruminococcaceae bacterium OttesenSCG-928-L11]|nr:hypothetical protein [Ruminococcaceae bacterium OttesenSCG-928-L11]